MTDSPLSNENLQICSLCGGACCRTRPGIEEPDRFTAAADPAAHLAALLASGKWVLERHMGLPVTPETEGLPDRMYLITCYPRPATRQEKEARALFALPGTGDCVFLAPQGCTLPFQQRPRLCRSLEPDPAYECHSSWTRPAAALAWWPLQGMVREALARLGEQPPPP